MSSGTLTIYQFRENHFSCQCMVSGTCQYCAVIGQDVVGEMFTLTIGQFRENHFNVWSVVLTSTVMPLDKRLVGQNANFDHWSVKYAEEEILLN